MSSKPDQLETLRRYAEGKRYPLEAFVFVINGLVFARQHVQYDPKPPYQRGGHLDAVDICWCLHDYALVLFGTRAREQLNEWHIERTEDFGNVLYGLIECGLAKKLDEDSLDDFASVFDFDQEFREPEELTIVDPQASKDERRRYPQFSLRWLLFAMLVAGVGLSWLGNLWRRAERQRAAVAEIRRQGGQVVYRYGNRTVASDLVGVDFANDVRAVLLPQSGLTSSNIDDVVKLSNVDWLTLSQVDDPALLLQLSQLRKLRTVLLTAPASDKLLENLCASAPRLERLHLLHRQLTDEGLRSVGQLPQLEALFITSDVVTDAGIRHLRNLRSLKILHVQSAGLQGDCLRELSSLTRLEDLELSRTSLRSESLAHLVAMKSLRDLDLSESKVDDRGVAHLAKMSQLRRLNLAATRVTEASLEHLRIMKWLQRLNITCPLISTASTKILQEELPETRVLDERLYFEIMKRRMAQFRVASENNTDKTEEMTNGVE